MFSFIKTYCKKMYAQVAEKFSSLFSQQKIDESFFKELNDILLSSDVGVSTSNYIMQELKNRTIKLQHLDGMSLKTELADILKTILHTTKPITGEKSVFLFVGINGSGKTTTIAKLAHYFVTQQKKVLCVAADTFRAAATEQLELWSKKIGCDLVQGKIGQDPASVVFAGCEKGKKEAYDILLIDTAGRLQTKTHLMAELAKIKRIIEKHVVPEKIITLLVLDAMLGQNSLLQAKIFQEATQVNGVVLSKMDGTAKGGFVFAIARELQLPVLYVTFGEQTEQIKPFSADEFVSELLLL
jgi:fused signal recognition particle receptor